MSITPTRRHRPRRDSDERVCTWTRQAQASLFNLDRRVKTTIEQGGGSHEYEIRAFGREHPTHSIADLARIDLRSSSHRDMIQLITRWNELVERASVCDLCPVHLPEATRRMRMTSVGLPNRMTDERYRALLETGVRADDISTVSDGSWNTYQNIR
jgi:hypothetical protein